MNTFNRVLASAVLAALLLGALAMAAVPAQTLGAAARGLDSVRSALAGDGAVLSWPYLAGRVLVPAVVALLSLALLWAELRSSRPKSVRVLTEGGSRARVATESVERRLAFRVSQVADVVAAAPRVSARGRNINVALDVVTGPNIDVPMKTDEIVAVAREVITERMGLQAGKIEVHIKHAAFEEDSHA